MLDIKQVSNTKYRNKKLKINVKKYQSFFGRDQQVCMNDAGCCIKSCVIRKSASGEILLVDVWRASVTDNWDPVRPSKSYCHHMFSVVIEGFLVPRHTPRFVGNFVFLLQPHFSFCTFATFFCPFLTHPRTPPMRTTKYLSLEVDAADLMRQHELQHLGPLNQRWWLLPNWKKHLPERLQITFFLLNIQDTGVLLVSDVATLLTLWW